MFFENRSNEKHAFISSIIAGLAIHMYSLVNPFLTYDSMWNLYSTQDMITSGRPFLQYVCIPTTYYDLTWINGLAALLYLAFAASFLINTLDIKNKILISLVSICVVGFPSMASLFCYSFTMDGYAIAILLAIFSVWICKKYKYGFLFGALTLGISMGVYQAYLSLAALLCLFVLVFDMEEKRWKEILTSIFKMLLMGILSFLFYLISLRSLLYIKNESLSGYQGTNEVFDLDVRNLFFGIKNAYVNFIDFARYGGVLTPNIYAKITLLLIVCLSGIMFLHFLFIIWNKQGTLRTLCTMSLICLIPIATSTIAIISPNTFFHILLRYPWMLFFVFAIGLIDRSISEHKENRNRALGSVKNLLVGLVFVLLFNYAVTANVVYFNMNERYEKTYATSLRILMRLEEVEGYTNDTEVAILGGVLYPDFFFTEEASYEVTKNYFGSSGILAANDTDKFAEFMKHYFGKKIQTIGLEREIELTETTEYKEMGRFPEKTSVGWINGVLVVKLNG